MVYSIRDPEDTVSSEFVTTRTMSTAKDEKSITHLRALNTAIGCMEFSVTRHHVQDIGRAGMELLRSNFALADYYTTKKPTPVTGLKTSEVVKNILCAKMMLMAMCL